MTVEVRYFPDAADTPALMQKLADLLCDKGLEFWGFHNVIGSVEKHLPEGYHSLLDFLVDYAMALDLFSTGDLDKYMPPDDEELTVYP
jgi:hypothetical protein